MGMFKDLSTESLEAPVDYLGGNFDPIATGVYEATIKLAFAGQSKSSKAQSVTLHLDLDGKELRETVYVTNRNNENFYVDKTDKTKRHPLPGWTAIDDICLLTELLSNLVFEGCRSCGDLVWVCGFNSVFERDAGDDFGEVIKAA